MSSERSSYRDSWLWRTYAAAAQAVDNRISWHRLPRPIGILLLIGLQTALRRRNLVDTSTLPTTNLPPVGPPDPRSQSVRTADGTYNDPTDPRLGMAGARFGRNVPNEATWPDDDDRILTPSPREVSRAMLTRREFIPATSVNTLAAVWLQFMIRDWSATASAPPRIPGGWLSPTTTPRPIVP